MIFKHFYMFTFKRLLFITLLPFLFVMCNDSDEPSPIPQGRTLDYVSTVHFLDIDGEVITTIEAAIADTDLKRSEGLMNVRNMPADKGMIFLFDDEAPRSFWMANTPLPLDIIFVDANWEIIRIHQSAPAFTERNFESGAPAKYVVEVNGGFTMRHDIREGMRIEFSMMDEG
jgi:uncharacterized membrane protein (UPF0127 family)